MKYVVTLRDRTYEVEVEAGEAMVLDEYEAKAPAAAQPPASAPGTAAEPSAPAAAATPAVPASGTVVAAPLPGNVLAVNVAAGDAVKEGDVLLLIEAMKMENEVAAPSDGVVQQVCVSAGAVVNTGDTLMVI